MLRSSLRGGGSTPTVEEENDLAIGCDPCSGSLRKISRALDLRESVPGNICLETSRVEHREQRGGRGNSGAITDGVHGLWTRAQPIW